jgi:hypothetical protein
MIGRIIAHDSADSSPYANFMKGLEEDESPSHALHPSAFSSCQEVIITDPEQPSSSHAPDAECAGVPE